MDDRAKVDCIANARALAPVIAAATPRIEANRELPADLIDALHEARLWRMLLPRSYGGDEVSPVDYVQAIEEIAKADASTAWCIGQTSVCGTITRNMKPEIAEEMFKKNPRGVLAWGPTNNAKAVADTGGYRVNGVWPFASGSKHATWLAAHCFIYEADGQQRRDASGKPVQKTFVVPRERATFQDVWHVMGLKGTGSNTYTLTDVLVPEDYAVDYHALDPAQRREHGPLYKFTIYQLFGSSFPAIALGIARTMLDDFCALAQGKTPRAKPRYCARVQWCNRRSASCNRSSPRRARFFSKPGGRSGKAHKPVRRRWSSASGCVWRRSTPARPRCMSSSRRTLPPAPPRFSRPIRSSAGSATCMRCRNRRNRNSRSTRRSAGTSSACRTARGWFRA